MHKNNRFLFLLLCSGVCFLVVLLSRRVLVVISTKPFKTFKIRQLDGRPRTNPSASMAIDQQSNFNNTDQANYTISQQVRKTRPKPVACVPPPIHPFDPSLSNVLESYAPLNCSSGLPSVVMVTGESTNILHLTVDRALVKQKLSRSAPPACRYRALNVKHGGDFNTTSTRWSGFFTDSIQVGAREEHFVVECRAASDPRSALVAKSYISVVRERRALEKSLQKKLLKHLKDYDPKETLNVLVLGIDGMSKQNMIRTLPQTRDFLLGTLKAKEMLNYNKNGMNTFPNVITMLTGKTVSEISSEYSWDTGQFFDNISFVWDEFAEAGYRTQMALDSSRVTSFHCSKQGFSRPPVHYYHRALVLESEPDALLRHKHGNCVGDVPEVTLLLDYVSQMASKFSTRGRRSNNGAENEISKSEDHARSKRSVPKKINGFRTSIGNVIYEYDKRTGRKISPQNPSNSHEEETKRVYVGHQTTKPYSTQNDQLRSEDFTNVDIEFSNLHGQDYRQKRVQQRNQHQASQPNQQAEQQQQRQAAVRPFFSYNFFVRLTHDNPQKASSGDVLYEEFFRSLHTSGALNNTVLIFFSDHGPRFGPLRRTIVGTMEDRMPFCLLAFPPWFLRKYPEVDRALTTNQNRLTSHFDIHATLRHILYFDGGGGLSTTTAPPTVGDGKAEAISPESHRTVPLSPGNDSPYDDKQRRVLRAIPSLSPGSARSMSLFREIPRDRTCRDAGIDFQWCSCNRLEPVDSQDALVRLLAFEFALLLSDKTLRARQVCHQLNLARVRSAMKVTLAGEETPGEDKRPLDEASPGNKQFSKLLEPLGAAANRTSGRLPRQSDGEDKKPNRAIHKSSTAQTSIYLLSIETRPGGAVFEGHLQFSLSDSSVRLLGTVLRLNMFQPQSMCVKEPGLKPFCFCKDLDDKV